MTSHNERAEMNNRTAKHRIIMALCCMFALMLATIGLSAPAATATAHIAGRPAAFRNEKRSFGRFESLRHDQNRTTGATGAVPTPSRCTVCGNRALNPDALGKDPQRTAAVSAYGMELHVPSAAQASAATRHDRDQFVVIERNRFWLAAAKTAVTAATRMIPNFRTESAAGRSEALEDITVHVRLDEVRIVPVRTMIAVKVRS